jgi:hypothetical protein
MADSLSMALTELLRKAEAEPDLDTLREGVRVLPQALMELDERSFLHKGGSLQALSDRRSELLDASSHHLNLKLLRRLGSVPLFIAAESVQALLQPSSTGAELIKGEGLGFVGIHQALDLALELNHPSAHIAQLGSALVATQAGSMGSVQRILEHSRFVQHCTDVRPHQRIQTIGWDLAARHGSRRPRITSTSMPLQR